MEPSPDLPQDMPMSQQEQNGFKEEPKEVQELREYLENCLESDQLFLSLCVRDQQARNEALSALVADFESWKSAMTKEEFGCKLKIYIGGLLRISEQSPFQEVREAFSNLIAQYKKEGLIKEHEEKINRSSLFIPEKQLPSFFKDDEVLHVLSEIFFQKGRISHINRILSFFPVYHSKFDAVNNSILYGQTQLPITEAIYLSILGASRHNCAYLIANQQIDFYEKGGDISWLAGIQNAPPKIQKIATLNALLAHRPWDIKPFHIEELTNGEDSWTISELVLAISVLSTFHCLAGLVAGLGIELEIDRIGGFANHVLNSVHEEEIPDGEGSQNNSLLVTWLRFVSGRRHASDSSSVSSFSSSNSLSVESLKHFLELEEGWKPSKQEEEGSVEEDFSHFHGGVKFPVDSLDFKLADKVFRLTEFSWDEHGYLLVNRFCPALGDLFEETFKEAFLMTDCRLFDADLVDTGPLRQAIWYYTFRLKGMFHDDYDYSSGNTALNSKIKKYIKKIVCYPEMMSKKDYRYVGLDLFDREKVHVNILAFEARRQSAILYALNAIVGLKKA